MSEGSIEIPVTIKNAGFKAGLEGMKNSAVKFAHDVEHNVAHKIKDAFKEAGTAIAGVFAVEKIIEFGRAVLDMAGELQDMADRTNTSAESLQSLTEYFREAGAKGEDLSKGLVKLSNKMEEARGGNVEAVKAFEALGIQWRDIATASPERMLVLLADAMEKSTNPTKTKADLSALLGDKMAMKLAPGLKQGAKAMEEFKAAFKGLTEQEIGMLDMMGDKLSEYATKAKTLGGQAIVGTVYYASKYLGKGEEAKKIEEGATDSAGRKMLDKAKADSPQPTEENVGENPREKAERAEAEKAEDELAKKKMDLYLQVQALEESNSMAAMTNEQQLYHLLVRRSALQQLMAQMQYGSLEHLEKEKQILETSNAIRAKTAANAHEHESQQAKVAGLHERGEKLDEEYKLGKMSKPEQVKYLKEQQAGVVKEANDAKHKGDMETYEKKANEAREYRDKIDKASEADPEKKPGKLAQVSVSASRRIGAGGGIGSGMADPTLRHQERMVTIAEKQLRALQDIAGRVEPKKEHAPLKY